MRRERLSFVVVCFKVAVEAYQEECYVTCAGVPTIDPPIQKRKLPKWVLVKGGVAKMNMHFEHIRFRRYCRVGHLKKFT